MSDSKKKEKDRQFHLTRRKFLESTAIGGLAAGFGRQIFDLNATEPPSADKGSGIELKVVGHEAEGFGVTFLYRGQAVGRHARGGEFSGVFQNGERSLEDRIENWKAKEWKGDAKQVSLLGECRLANVNASVQVEVHYDVIAVNVVRKKIRFQQRDMFLLFHQVSNRLEPAQIPAKYWSFDQADCKGGALHENFPAAGFLLNDNICVGLLTDSGFRNQWSRVIRRDEKPVKPAPRRIPDPFLYVVPTHRQREANQLSLEQTFGEMLELVEPNAPSQVVAIPDSSSWRSQGQAGLEFAGERVVLATSSSQDGVLIPISADAGGVFSIRLKYRSESPVTIQLWGVNEKLEKLHNLTLYNDVAPGSGDGWSDFHNTVFVPSWEGVGGAVYISLPESEQGTKTHASRGMRRIEFSGLELRRVAYQRQPYHRLEMDRPLEKTVFIFIDDTVSDSARGYRMASQVHLANGLGFEGGETEKCLYADVMMLCWNADTEERRPILAPSIWYSAAGEMYLRDSFYALQGIHNRELNESVFQLWGENQGEDGAINTLVEPNMANLERKSNDSTPLWLMWALLNRRRFGTQLPEEKIRMAVEYCLRTYDRRKDATCWAQFVMGQLDVISYPQGTSDLCENQGVFAVMLRTIKALAIPGVSEKISEEYLLKAEEIYRSYYVPSKKFLAPIRGVTDAIGFAELFPEFLSLWLFGRKMLTDEMVKDHLDRIPALLPRTDAPYPEAEGTVRPIFIGIPESGGWSYFTEKWHPMISEEHAANYAGHIMDGVYYNGGSWMRIEFCGYVTGFLHGWAKARQAIANRLWAEVRIAKEFPTSQEYLATFPENPFFGFHRVFAWNSFVLQALELTGMRSAEMDPDFKRVT